MSHSDVWCLKSVKTLSIAHVDPVGFKGYTSAMNRKGLERSKRACLHHQEGGLGHYPVVPHVWYEDTCTVRHGEVRKDFVTKFFLH